MLYIKNATVFAPHGTIGDGAVLTEDSRIVAVGRAADVACPDGAHVVDASGMLLAPGFIDLQFNGGFGYDFTADPTAIWQVAEGLTRYGVTAFLPTIITSPLEKIAAGQRVVTEGRREGFRGATPLGLHVEGPFLNPKKKGAHNPAYLRLPDPDAVRDWSPETGIRLVTLAPELPGALELARQGLLPGGMVRNRAFAEAYVEAEGLEQAFADLLFDPQTSGGLLVAMDPADADAFEAALKEKAPLARRVGFVREASLGKIAVLA